MEDPNSFAHNKKIWMVTGETNLTENMRQIVENMFLYVITLANGSKFLFIATSNHAGHQAEVDLSNNLFNCSDNKRSVGCVCMQMQTKNIVNRHA